MLFYLVKQQDHSAAVYRDSKTLLYNAVTPKLKTKQFSLIFKIQSLVTLIL